VAAAPAAVVAPADAGARKLTYKEKIELEKLPGLIEKAEQAVAELEASMADPAFFAKSRELTEKTLKAHADAQAGLQKLYDRWAALDG